MQPALPGDGVFDGSVLDEIRGLGMGAGFEREFIAQCLLDAETCLGALAAAGEGEDWERLREQAHALKGVASNLGLIKLAAAGGEAMGLPDWQLAHEWQARVEGLRDRLVEGKAALDAHGRQHARREEGERSP